MSVVQPALSASLPRSVGTAQLRFANDGITRLRRRARTGCVRVFTPRVDMRDPEVVLLNTAGGLTDGDQLQFTVHWSPAARATVTTPAAERVYRSLGDDARIDIRLVLEDEARGCWLPQETILFDGGRLRRVCQVEVHPSARFVALETLILGRAASGEQLESGRIHDTLRVRRGGRLVFADDLRMSGALQTLGRRQGVMRGCGVHAMLVCVAPEAEQRVAALQALLRAGGGLAGATAWDGVLVMRALAPDNLTMRRLVAAGLDTIGFGPLPHSWNC